MVSVFGDESADEGCQYVFAVAGLIGFQSQWEWLRPRWLETTGGKEFHAAEWETEYANTDTEKHKANLRSYAKLTQLIVRSGLRGNGVALDLVGFREFFPDVMALTADAPYYKCFSDTLAHLLEMADAYHDPDGVKFTFDRRPQSEYNAGRLYDYMVNQDEWRSRNILLDTEISFDTRRNVFIQAADLVARETMKELLNHAGPVRRPMRASLEALATANYRIRFDMLTRDYCRDWKAKVTELGKRIGLDEKNYADWLTQRRRQDNMANRISFLVWDEHRNRLGGSSSLPVTFSG